VIQLLEHLIRVRTIGAQNLVLLESEQKMIDVLIAKGMSDFSIAEINDLLNNSIYEIERNANTKILFHSLSLRIQKIVLRKNRTYTS
jgi:DNA polymerase-3 subunit delta'